MNWRKGPAQGNGNPQGFATIPDEPALFAVWVRCVISDTWSYQYAVGSLDDDFDIQTDDGFWGWTWDDVDWWVPMSEIEPPAAVGAGGGS